jgi:hypothetical protein
MMRALAELPADAIKAAMQVAAAGLLQVPLVLLLFSFYFSSSSFFLLFLSAKHPVSRRCPTPPPPSLPLQAVLQEQAALRSSLQQQHSRETASDSKFQARQAQRLTPT